MCTYTGRRPSSWEAIERLRRVSACASAPCSDSQSWDSCSQDRTMLVSSSKDISSKPKFPTSTSEHLFQKLGAEDMDAARCTSSTRDHAGNTLRSGRACAERSSSMPPPVSSTRLSNLSRSISSSAVRPASCFAPVMCMASPKAFQKYRKLTWPRCARSSFMNTGWPLCAEGSKSWWVQSLESLGTDAAMLGSRLCTRPSSMA
mmetsp:Transcript_64195/g.184415  ORF Transcript_64195/g.184415 Transcript_64195/m.184415 type:complete len:203 (+) Transcript_64195:527-1135(+)